MIKNTEKKLARAISVIAESQIGINEAVTLLHSVGGITVKKAAEIMDCTRDHAASRFQALRRKKLATCTYEPESGAAIYSPTQAGMDIVNKATSEL